MKALVIHDDQGRIISVSRPGDVGDEPSGIAGAGILPEPGQYANYVELPEKLKDEQFLDLHKDFRVEVKGEQVRLVKAQDFTEPFREKKY